MSIETINFKDEVYPKIQSTGHASRFCLPFALEFLTGDVIYDIGYSQKEWMFPNAVGIDVKDDSPYHGMNLPPLSADGIFNSHLLEHMQDIVGVLDYWNTVLKVKGVLFMYLPNMDYQLYWRCTNNRKHVSYMNPQVIKNYFEDRKEMWSNVFVTEGYDLNGSFYAIAEKI